VLEAEWQDGKDNRELYQPVGSAQYMCNYRSKGLMVGGGLALEVLQYIIRKIHVA